MSAGGSTLWPGPDGWLLAPEGAVVRAEERVAVIADVHLGYEWARASRGDMLPPHSRCETLARLDSLHRRFAFRRLIVAGDLVESPLPGPTTRDIEAIAAHLRSLGAELVRLRGNHEGKLSSLPPSLVVSGWTIAHGDEPITADFLICGHVHSILRMSNVTAPCFLVGPNRIVLPAFTPNAAGWNVAGGGLPGGLAGGTLRCIATSGNALLDFGPINELSKRRGMKTSW